jgi:hypothetical protein
MATAPASGTDPGPGASGEAGMPGTWIELPRGFGGRQWRWLRGLETIYAEHPWPGFARPDWDCLGRSLQDLVAFLGDVHAQGVDLYLDRQGVDTTTPGGKALFQMMGVFAEFEPAIIRERVCAGLDKARAKGSRLGRPKVPASVEQAIRDRLATGKGQLATARELKVGVSTVRRIVLGKT